MAYNPTFAMLSSLKPFFFNNLKHQYFGQNLGSRLCDDAIVTQLFVIGAGFFQAVPLG
jgi:hypothetical protein